MAKDKKTLDELLQGAIVKDAPYEVPGNWVWSNINTISFEIKNGTTIKQNKEGNGIKVTRIESIQNNTIDFKRIGYVVDNSKIKDKDYYKNGDIALSHINSIEHVGKTALITEEMLPLIHGMNLLRIRFYKQLINPQLFQLYTQSYDFKEEVVNKVNRAVNQVSLNQKMLSQIKFPIPPIKEQERIVEKVEGLFEKLDKAKKLIEEVREDFEKRKASILEKAFRGELTEKWREENKYTLESLKELLLKQNKLIKKGFSYDKAIEIYNIPIEWKWIKLKDISEKFKYGTSKKSIKEGKVPVLRMGNLQNGKIDWNDLVYTNDESDILKYELKKGDILFNRTNSPELVGKTSIYDGLIQSIYAGYLIRIRVLNSIESKYVNYFMNSIIAKRRCMEVKTDGVSQSNINAEKLGQFDIPICSLEEQKEIVRILDKLLEEENKIEKLTNLENQIELTKKSILAKAFRGELGTNDPSEESAMELLKEVLQEKL